MNRKRQNVHSKKCQKRIAGILALVMALCALPLHTLAASYTVGDADEMVNSWIAASGNKDTSNTFNMTSDINMNGQSLEVTAGKDYIINGKGNTLSNVVIEEYDNVPNENKQADVTIKAEVENTGNGSALEVTGDVNVTVNEDVTATGVSPAVIAQNGAEVKIKEDVEATGGGSAIVVISDATVTVTGDVESKVGPTIIVSDGYVKVGGDVTLNNTKDYAPDAVSAGDQSTVIINGNLISGGDALLIKDSAMTVDGDIVAGSSAMNVTNSSLTVNGDILSDGQSVITKNSDVTVNGDFKVQFNEGQVTQDGGLFVTEGSTLHMADNTMLESDQMHVSGNSTLDAAYVDTAQVTVGVIENNPKDTSTFYAYSNTVSSSLGTLDAAGRSKTQIIGHVGTVNARQNAVVDVFGNIGKVNRKDNARVTKNISDADKTQSYVPAAKGEDYTVGNTTAHAIINMCNNYTANSNLKKQNSEMLSLLADVSSDISEKLNVGSAAWASLFDHEKVNVSFFLREDAMLNDWVLYGTGSLLGLELDKPVNGYLVEMYKANLAKSMADLTSKPDAYNPLATEGGKLVAEIFKFTKNIEDASGVYLSEAEKKYLKNAAGADGDISGPEMLKFLRDFGYYTEDDPGSVLRAQQLSRSYGEISEFMQDAAVIAKAMKAGVVISDLVEYIITDYSNQLIILEQMLENEALSAEMKMAILELRTEIQDKRAGAFERIANQIKKDAAGMLKDQWGPLSAGQAVIDILGLVTGGTKDAEDLQNGAALTIMTPQLLQAFEASIQKVQDGDTSEEAVRQVYMNYTVLRRSLINMCDVMTNIGDRKQEKEYKEILKKLETMELGQFVDLVK